MSGREPSLSELKRAVRFLRHVENCNECKEVASWRTTCCVGYGHYLRWNDIYWEEVKDA